MWTFAGCCVIALVLNHRVKALHRTVMGMGYILERLGNRAAERTGDPPVFTHADAADISRY